MEQLPRDKDNPVDIFCIVGGEQERVQMLPESIENKTEPFSLLKALFPKFGLKDPKITANCRLLFTFEKEQFRDERKNWIIVDNDDSWKLVLRYIASEFFVSSIKSTSL